MGAYTFFGRNFRKTSLERFVGTASTSISFFIPLVDLQYIYYLTLILSGCLHISAYYNKLFTIAVRNSYQYYVINSRLANVNDQYRQHV